jgi:hypothetical protein
MLKLGIELLYAWYITGGVQLIAIVEWLQKDEVVEEG